jgi:hypothetical protein
MFRDVMHSLGRILGMTWYEDWINQAQNGIKWLVPVNTVMILPVPYTVRNLLVSSASNSIYKIKLSRIEIHSAPTDHADSYILKCPIARSEVFCCLFNSLSFCSNTEHSQYRVSAVDVSPDLIRPEDDWKQDSGNKGRILF